MNIPEKASTPSPVQRIAFHSGVNKRYKNPKTKKINAQPSIIVFDFAESFSHKVLLYSILTRSEKILGFINFFTKNNLLNLRVSPNFHDFTYAFHSPRINLSFP